LADATGWTVLVTTPRFTGLIGAAALATPALGWSADPLAAIRASVVADACAFQPDVSQRRFFDLRYAEFTVARRWVVPWTRLGDAGINAP
jgi:hypothetical protein